MIRVLFSFHFCIHRRKRNKSKQNNKSKQEISKNKEEKPNDVEEKKNKNIILKYFQVEMMVIISILGDSFPFQSKQNSTLRPCSI